MRLSNDYMLTLEHATCGTVAEGSSLEIEESQDLNDPNAQEILLESVEVET